MTTQPDDRPTEWHRLTVREAARRLDADPGAGLGEDEAERRLGTHGPNRLPEPERPSAWRRLLRQFNGVLTLVLIAAAIVSAAIGDLTDAAVILAVVVFNAVLGFQQEHRADRILDALRGMLAPQADVRRGGRVRSVDSACLVPGDLVLLEAGDRVPADGRLVSAHDLEIDEASLTGESAAVAKHADALDGEDVALGDRANLAFSNTVITRGRAEMLVTGTGLATEVGRLVRMIQAAQEGPTPLQRKLDQLGRVLAGVAIAVILVILAMGLWRGEPLGQLVLTAVALAVAAIPEGLPAVVTVTLALGMYAMARRGAIVKRLAAVETLGSTTVICSDKTGTLTMNQMTVRALVLGGRHVEVTGEGYGAQGGILPPREGMPSDLPALLRAAALCNDSHIADGALVGDPTEGALLALAAKGGAGDPRRAMPRLAEVPFRSETRLMATFHRDGDDVLLCVKGAPDALAGLCRLNGETRARLGRDVEDLGGRALRVLALAEKRLPASVFAADAPERHLDGLRLLGLAGLMDPPRPDVRRAVADCHGAGIAVKMITGDHRVTAAAIAREIGIPGAALTGRELERMDDAALADRIDGTGVFARVAPEHKVRIVEALRRRGHVVAMTGDGVNDAPALKTADIGVAMGAGGTDVAREAAAMVLTDDNFATIVGAVRQGRTIYDNVLKFLRFQLSTNIGALLTVFAAPLLGLPMPFTPVQILWVNIIMDGPPAMALAFDPPRPGVMRAPPRRPDEPILGARRLARILGYGATMAVGTLLVFAMDLAHGDLTHAGTLAFTTFVLFQVFNVFNARVGRSSAFNATLFRNWKLWAALAGILALQAVAVYWPPARAVFHTAPLSAQDWALAAAVASSVLVLDEARKLAARVFSLSPRGRGPG